MPIIDNSARFTLGVPLKASLIMIAAAFSAVSQVCVLSPDTIGGSQYNEPQPYTATTYGQSVGVAWPQGASVYYVEYQGIHDGYYDVWPSDYQSSLGTAYGNWNSSSYQNNSIVGFSYFGTNDNGLPSVDPNFANPSFQPWHLWIAVDQSELSSSATLAETSSEFENYGSTAVPYFALGTARTLATNSMSVNGASQSYEAKAFAHEIGHTMALDDCGNCNAGSGGTIMSYNNAFFYNSSLNITGPQYCDNVQTQQTAYPY